jgi:hypothetical protein
MRMTARTLIAVVFASVVILFVVAAVVASLATTGGERTDPAQTQQVTR